MSNIKSQTDHIFHVWINRRQEERRMAGEEHEHGLYEFKNMLSFLEYGHKRIQQAFENALPKTHKQCSLSPTESIHDNRLTCAFGIEVATCPILAHLKTTFDEERQRECGQLGKHYAGIPDEEVYRKMAVVCAWNIFTTSVNADNTTWGGIDTSEGYHLDETDRRFWRRVYDSMAAPGPGDDA